MSAPQLLGPAAAMRLAETFAHFLWQGSAIVLVVALAWPALRRASASARYRVLVFALLLTAAAPVVTFWTLNANEATGARRATSKGSAPSTLPELTPVIPRAFPLDQVRPRGGAIQPPSVAEYPSAFERYAPALLAAYAVGVLGMLIRLVWSPGRGPAPPPAVGAG